MNTNKSRKLRHLVWTMINLCACTDIVSSQIPPLRREKGLVNSLVLALRHVLTGRAKLIGLIGQHDWVAAAMLHSCCNLIV